MDKKDEEFNTSGNPFKRIEKASVLQEVVKFNLTRKYLFLNLLLIRLVYSTKQQLIQENAFKF